MKLAVVYNPLDHKLREDAYSYIYKGMLDALLTDAVSVTKNCHADEIDADVILFYDPNSCHHIQIDGVDKHPALKMEYMSDPHQEEVRGVYKQFDLSVHKLNAEQRMRRAHDRGVEYIVTPVDQGFVKYLAQYANGIKRYHFPLAPSFKRKFVHIEDRKPEVLGNGATWAGGLKCYNFRRYLYAKDYITVVNHWFLDHSVPSGKKYSDLLYQYAGGLACSEFYPVPKYYEMPYCGTVTFAQYHKEYEELGFKDETHCIYIHLGNYEKKIKDFLNHPEDYQKIARNGYDLMGNYSAKKFGEFVRETATNLIH